MGYNGYYYYGYQSWTDQLLRLAGSATFATWLLAIAVCVAVFAVFSMPVRHRRTARRTHRSASLKIASHAMEVVRDAIGVSGDLSVRANWVGPLPTDSFRFADEAMGQVNLQEIGDEGAVRNFLGVRAALDRVGHLVPLIDEIGLNLIHGDEQPADRFEHAMLWNTMLGHYHRGRQCLLDLAPQLLEPAAVAAEQAELARRFPIIEEARAPSLPRDTTPRYPHHHARLPWNSRSPELTLSRAGGAPAYAHSLGELSLSPRYAGGAMALNG